ncbi:hypothetical protein FisN_17Hu270 [Fistulifera solaris]|uniref:Uncharacterized protein n=1 Tax=Fistulifera solaris TaxID=1519565 RepID=A0A1Z5JH57_FISSO|nr:hypothetical protein FisN_17Hu270 [Fistulifera solaris]|eukprot:GAX13329.1 hypothetical protein FisN_17Hu270 [Fistulifera solaris]
MLGAMEGLADGLLDGSEVDGIAVIVGSDVMVGIALAVGNQVSVGKAVVGKLEVEGHAVVGAKDAEGDAEEVGVTLLLVPIEGAKDGLNDVSLKEEGANDGRLLFGASDRFAFDGANEGIALLVELRAAGAAVGIPCCKYRSMEISQWGPVNVLSLQTQ